MYSCNLSIIYDVKLIIAMSTVIDMSTAVEAEDDQCYLLELPPELQLLIYRLAVHQSEILLINMPCNSSYRNGKGSHFEKKMKEDEEAWKSGAKQPPKQPAITQVCRFIRAETLPLYYGLNVFRARYCTLFEPGPLPDVVRWLKMIGEKSREMLKHFYFYDRRKWQDRDYAETLEKLKGSDITTEMGGTIETLSDMDSCVHRLTFSEKARKTAALPVVRGVGTKVLRLEGEN